MKMKVPCTCFLILAVTLTSHGAHPSSQRQRNGLPDVFEKGWTKQEPWMRDDQDRIEEGQLFPRFRHEINLQAPIPSEYDWRTFGVISPVKNSGQLGSSVATAAAECVESLHAIESSRLVLLSASEVQDCCNVRLLTNSVFDCIANIGGICGDQTYPMATGVCRNNTCAAEAEISGGRTVARMDVLEMVMALLERPLMVLVDASQTSFQTYTGGIYSDPDCSTDRVDHAMQVVGYGEEDGQEYWTCKNSFGEEWGEEGYIRISKGDNTCGIESFVSYPF